MEKKSKSIYLQWLKWTALFIALIIGMFVSETAGAIFGLILSIAVLSAPVFFLFIVLTGRHRRGPSMPGGGPVVGVWDGGGDFGSGGGGCGGCGGGGCGGGCGGCGGCGGGGCGGG